MCYLATIVVSLWNHSKTLGCLVIKTRDYGFVLTAMLLLCSDCICIIQEQEVDSINFMQNKLLKDLYLLSVFLFCWHFDPFF